jgi:putative DNA primase/helicase
MTFHLGSTWSNVGGVRGAPESYAADVAVLLLGPPNRRLSTRRELRFGNKGSLAVVIAGPKTGAWFDHESGTGGDLIDLIRRKRGGSLSDAIAYNQQVIGSGSVRTTIRAARPISKPALGEEDNRSARALALWGEGVPITGTLAGRYLEQRRVFEPALEAGDGVLRFHPLCTFGEGTRHPCLLALLREIHSNEPRAILRTALTSRSETIGRMALGPWAGSAIKLSADENVAQGLAVGEGLETVLAAMQLGFCPAWALGGTSGTRTFLALSGVECLTILVDNDKNGAGQQAARECSERWTDAGRQVLWAVPSYSGDDFNDVLRWSAT